MSEWTIRYENGEPIGLKPDGWWPEFLFRQDGGGHFFDEDTIAIIRQARADAFAEVEKAIEEERSSALDATMRRQTALQVLDRLRARLAAKGRR